MDKKYALVVHPLSQSFQNELIEKAGSDIEFLLLGELREKKLKRLLSFLIKLNVDTFFIPTGVSHFEFNGV